MNYSYSRMNKILSQNIFKIFYCLNQNYFHSSSIDSLKDKKLFLATTAISNFIKLPETLRDYFYLLYFSVFPIFFSKHFSIIGKKFIEC